MRKPKINRIGGQRARWPTLAVRLSPEDAAVLAAMAAKEGLRPVHLVEDLVTQYLKERAA